MLGDLSGPAREREHAVQARELARLFAVNGRQLPAEFEGELQHIPQREHAASAPTTPHPAWSRAAEALHHAVVDGQAAATIDWHEYPDGVLAELAKAADRLRIAPLWSDEEATRWVTADEFTWQLVDRIADRFEERGFIAFDFHSEADGYSLVWLREADVRHASALLGCLYVDGYVRVMKRRKYAG